MSIRRLLQHCRLLLGWLVFTSTAEQNDEEDRDDVLRVRSVSALPDNDAEVKHSVGRGLRTIQYFWMKLERG